MANNEKRSCLRGGLESAIFDLVGTGTATEQWAEWLNFPLQHAAAVGDENLVMVLKKAGANGSASHEAGQAILAPHLVKRGTSVTGTYERGGSANHRSAALGDEETASLLLEKGALPNDLIGTDRGPLYSAAAEGRLADANARSWLSTMVSPW